MPLQRHSLEYVVSARFLASPEMSLIKTGSTDTDGEREGEEADAFLFFSDILVVYVSNCPYRL